MNESDIVRVTRYRLGLHSRIHPYPKVASEFLFPPSVTGARIKGQGARSQPSFTTRKLLGPLVHYRGCSHHNFLPFYSRVCSPIKYLNASPKSWPRAPMTTFPPPPPRPFHPPAHALHTWKSPPNPSTRISTAIRSRIDHDLSRQTLLNPRIFRHVIAYISVASGRRLYPVSRLPRIKRKGGG